MKVEEIHECFKELDLTSGKHPCWVEISTPFRSDGLEYYACIKRLDFPESEIIWEQTGEILFYLLDELLNYAVRYSSALKVLPDHGENSEK